MSGGGRGPAALLITLVLTALAGAGSASAAVIGGCTIAPATQCPGANLSGADLSGADLSGANLQGANLSGANLDGANLSQANLTNASLGRTTGRRANLRGARADGSSLYFAHFPDAVLDHASFHGAYLAYFDARHASIQYATFIHAELSGALFDHADLRHANLTQTTLEGTEFNGADLRGAYFTHAHFSGTQMHAADVTGTHLWPSNLESDPVAFPQLFEKVAAHLDAYGDYGGCMSGATFTGSYGVFASGSCTAKGQPGGSHGFNNTANKAASFYWEHRSQREMTVKGEHGVTLVGHCNDNWSVFTVTSVKGLNAFSTSPPHGRAAGSPGGPLVLSIHYRGYYSGIQHRDGYIMFMHGWLPREAYPPVPAGPRPL